MTSVYTITITQCLVLMAGVVNRWVKMMRKELCEDPPLASLPSEILPISALNERSGELNWILNTLKIFPFPFLLLKCFLKSTFLIITYS